MNYNLYYQNQNIFPKWHAIPDSPLLQVGILDGIRQSTKAMKIETEASSTYLDKNVKTFAKKVSYLNVHVRLTFVIYIILVTTNPGSNADKSDHPMMNPGDRKNQRTTMAKNIRETAISAKLENDDKT